MNSNYVIKHSWLRTLHLTIFIFLALTQTILAITFFGEDFNSVWSTTNPPSGWRIAFTDDTSTNDWHRKDAYQVPWSANATPYACLIGSQTSGDSPDSLISPIIDCSNYYNIALHCSTYIVTYAGTYRAALYGSTDGGLSWPFEIRNYTNQTLPPQLEVFDLPWATNQPLVRFAWVFEGEPAGLAHWNLDNISLRGLIIHDTDIACVKIIRPKRFELPSPVPIPLIAKFANVGRQNQSNVMVNCEIRQLPDSLIVLIISDIIPVIVTGDTINFVFPNVANLTNGNYLITVSCDAVNDQDRSNDTLNKIFTVGFKNELGYDDSINVSDSSWIWERFGWGAKFKNELFLCNPVLVESVKFHCSVADTLFNKFRIRICDDDGTGGPGKPFYESGILTALSGWNVFDLILDSIAIWDSCFYVFFIQIEGSPLTPKLSRDVARNTEASYWICFDSSYIQDFTIGDWMIRCVLNYRFEYPRPLFNDFRTVFIGGPEENLEVRPSNRTFIPKARIENWGDSPQIYVPVVCSIISITNPSIIPYVSTKMVDLNPCSDTFLSFDPWVPDFRGYGRIKLKTMLPFDMNPANDVKEETIFVNRSAFVGQDFSMYDYRWIDSDTTGGPVFSWIDTSGWFYVIFQGDNQVHAVPLFDSTGGFSFSYYDSIYNWLWVSDNGWVQLVNNPVLPPQSYPNNSSIPDSLIPNNTIYAFWDDFAFGPLYGGGGIFFKRVGTAPYRKFVVIYQDVRRKYAPLSDPISYEVIFHENGSITLQYKDVFCSDARFNYGRGATIGIEDINGQYGLQYLYGEGGSSGYYPGNKLSESRAIKIYSSFIGLEEEHILQPIKRVSLQIYPNPVRSFLVFRLSQTVDCQELKIFDVSGKLVKAVDNVIRLRRTQEHKEEMRIPLKGINPGIYFLRLGKETKKFLVVK